MTAYTGSIHTINNKYNIINYRNKTVVDMYVSYYDVTFEVSEEIFKETLKFLYVRSQSHHEVLIPSKNIGQMWRLFLQDTQGYERFCHYYLRIYIHHRFNEDLNNDYSKDYQTTLDEINKHFSKKSNFWNESDYINKSLALKKDITFHNLQQPKIVRKSSIQSGCIETIILMFIISFFIIVTLMVNFYGISEY
ncbi:MAG: hypothetical protein AB8G11_12455 [Saprospiraceae bacterium]